MFNVVDTWYAGKLSTTSLAALSLSFPVFFLIIAFAGGFSTGVTAITGNELGAEKKKRAVFMAAQSFGLSIALSIVLTIGGQLLASPMFRILGAEGEYLAQALAYIRTIFNFSLFFILNNTMNGILQAYGDTKSYRNFLVIGFFLNLILDPLFIFGWLGLPKMGIAGVAMATVLVQMTGTVYMVFRIRSTGALEGAEVKSFIPDFKAWKELLGQGLPATLNSLTVGIGIFVITYFIGQFGEAAVAAYGAAVRIEQIALLPTIGISIAVLSITAQNSGAGKFDRVEETEKWALKYGLILLLPAAVFLLAAPSLLALFSDDPEVISTGARYLRIDSITLYAYVVLFVHVSMLQGMKRPRFAIIIGLFRQLIAPVPLFWLLSGPLGLGVTGVFWGIFGVTWAAALIAAFYGRRFLSKLKS
jgi:putative MATE family efflux protein